METVNALVVVNGETAYKEFVLDLNGRIDQNKAMLANRRTVAEKKKKACRSEGSQDPEGSQATQRTQDARSAEGSEAAGEARWWRWRTAQETGRETEGSEET